jgi:protocatechuate 3,4-dioxygenase beta subunit
LAFTDEQGHFEFAGLRPGRYRIAAQPAAGPAKARWVADFAHMMEIDVPGGVPTELELPVSKGGAQ